MMMIIYSHDILHNALCVGDNVCHPERSTTVQVHV